MDRVPHMKYKNPHRPSYRQDNSNDVHPSCHSGAAASGQLGSIQCWLFKGVCKYEPILQGNCYMIT